jgi:metal-responsive CopG/Arc/MetJ family transcriptional regulator
MRTASRTIAVNVPEEMLPAIDEAARRQQQSRSQLVRKALQLYPSNRLSRVIPLEDARPDEIEAIERGRAEFARGEFVRLVDLQHELGLPTE